MARKGKGEGVDGYIEPMELLFYGNVNTRIVLEHLSDCGGTMPRDHLDIYEEHGGDNDDSHKEKIRHIFSTSDPRIELVELGGMLEDPNNGLTMRFVLSRGDETAPGTLPDWPDPLTMEDAGRMITITVFTDGVEIVE